MIKRGLRTSRPRVMYIVDVLDVVFYFKSTQGISDVLYVVFVSMYVCITVNKANNCDLLTKKLLAY